MPATIICIGMAGSGKTTFVQRLNSHLHQKKLPPYIINLDPAVLKVPFGCNIDIRDSINYKKVMENYNLGPNGAIVTSLNLFSTKIDQVLNIIKKRDFTNCIVDTPGQIECFVWSASGSIITEAFATEFPTVIAYIIDTPRSSNPSTFMSNMLYACSILYKTKLPMIVVFNKTDIRDAKFAKDWMTDFESFQDSLKNNTELNDETSNGSGYMASLINSMSLMLEEFYSTLDVVSCSAFTGEGFDDFLNAVDNKVDEYNEFYQKERDRIILEKKEKEKKEKDKQLTHLMKDLGIKDKNNLQNKDDIDVLSDIEDEIERDEKAGYEHGLIDLESSEREYTFQEDRNGEIKDDSNASDVAKNIQDRYQQAFESTAKVASSSVAEDIAKYIKGE
ncbi:GPN-loop GTPase 1 [Pichia californica]|uniref:GPN-loop GTPase n=1 Tax=Pichia californica TaxID=460514 RepID=A0A9P7BDW1_9ASCO|nr:GPN-loop GTPase 1 [[Candida] californica]KAG0688592.1 GPN-loop GTPase 1 [[Candida] californica]